MLVGCMSEVNLFFRRVRDQGEFDEFIEEAGLKSRHFIIKPNWWNWGYAEYTEAETLEFLLRSLDGKITVTEGYSPRVDARMPEEETTATSSVRFLYTTIRQLGGALWISKGDRERIRRCDEEFLRETGIRKLFDEYDVDYVNVTEEVWVGNTVNREKIRKLVESKYSPVERHELYDWIPESLYRLRGSIFISFAKIKGVEPLNLVREEYRPSLAMKNFFGLIPHPLRIHFHGRDNCELDQNILDINKIYHSIFEVLMYEDYNY